MTIKVCLIKLDISILFPWKSNTYSPILYIIIDKWTIEFCGIFYGYCKVFNIYGRINSWNIPPIISNEAIISEKEINICLFYFPRNYLLPSLLKWKLRSFYYKCAAINSLLSYKDKDSHKSCAIFLIPFSKKN